jgi:hypothetical protein
MLKKIIVTATIMVFTLPCSAQSSYQFDSTADMGNLYNDSAPTTNMGGAFNDSQITSSNGAGSPDGPDLPGASSGSFGGPSGAANGAPILGSFAAPANLALRQIGMKSLPPTKLDSFVAQSGYNDMIYGDEGEYGPPPYDDFSTINSGIYSNLTTGHPSDAPSAWGYPN